MFTSATTQIAQLVKAHTQGQLDEKLRHVAKPELLIIDELGYLRLRSSTRGLHHSHVITIRSERYRLKDKRRAGLLTAHRQHDQHTAPSPSPSPQGVTS